MDTFGLLSRKKSVGRNQLYLLWWYISIDAEQAILKAYYSYRYYHFRLFDPKENKCRDWNDVNIIVNHNYIITDQIYNILVNES